jgi:membrane fusion protein
VTLLLTLFVVCLFAFLATAGFARKETVRGRLRPVAAEVQVFAEQPGVVTRLDVQLGDFIQSGATLLQINTQQQIDSTTNLSDASLSSLNEQRESLQARQDSVGTAARLSGERIQLEIATAKTEQISLTASIELAKTRIKIAQERVESAERLVAEGAASREELRVRQEGLIVLRQQLLDLTSQLNASEAHEAGLVVEAQKAREDLTQARADMDQRAAQLALQLAQTRANAGFAVKAPASGRIAALQVAPGERIDPRKPIMAILPEEQTLFAELYLPSRAIAFVEPGQPVRLLYDALPYQKFGPGAGKVQSVSRTTLGPEDLRGSVPTREPVYRVVVSLDQQQMTAFGKQVPLQSGMELSADIILEKRKLLEWLLEPLFAASVRMSDGP